MDWHCISCGVLHPHPQLTPACILAVWLARRAHLFLLLLLAQHISCIDWAFCSTTTTLFFMSAVYEFYLAFCFCNSLYSRAYTGRGRCNTRRQSFMLQCQVKKKKKGAQSDRETSWSVCCFSQSQSGSSETTWQQWDNLAVLNNCSRESNVTSRVILSGWVISISGLDRQQHKSFARSPNVLQLYI